MSMTVKNDGGFSFHLPPVDALGGGGAILERGGIIGPSGWRMLHAADGTLVLPPPTSADGTGCWRDLQRSMTHAEQNMPFDMSQLLRLLIEFASAQQVQDRENRQQDLAAKIHSLDTAADEVLNAAQQRFTGALLGGLMAVGAGAINIAGSVSGLQAIKSARTKILADSIGPAVEGRDPALLRDPDFQIRQFNQLTATSQSVSHLAQGVGGGVQGVGQMATGGMELSAGGHDKSKLKADEAAEVSEAAHASDNDMLQQHLETQRAIAAAAAEIEQERHATAKSQAQAV
ncbi:type III secretion system translocon subunit SctB [Rugamonas aquatica]|uniref:Uncharacterized protein n=1 Tax=Rugamonas aquatica TaxID=2743357 RepID=A0A6A7N6K3_9BURK|nr:type III secretion system translocon subunit SctB [Rugamonas aquatica]MQA40734.1 hypothetical protein [Rugamonas aquatica]